MDRAPTRHDSRSFSELSGARRGLVLAALILAGEAVFLLPFVLARVFRPTFLDVFGVTNLELGTAFSVYGIVAMIAYFAGGPLADLYSARRLMVAALVGTGLGGLVLATLPTPAVMNVLWGFWGLTTILLFWAAMLRATREWGGENRQGRAYGLLDGGRGLMAALIASVSVLVFAAVLPDAAELASTADREASFRVVIHVFTALTFAIAVFVWFVVPDNDPRRTGDAHRPHADGSAQVPNADRGGGNAPTLDGVRQAARMPVVWLQAVIVVCAYVGYKATDDFSLLARDVLAFDDVQAAGIGTLSFWMRAITAVAAGYLADRIDSSRVVLWGFALFTAGSLVIAAGFVPTVVWMFIGVIVTTSVGIYALRGVYFALLAEGNVPLATTGSAIGLVSLIGFTPDVFMGPLMGVLLDRSPGLLGHQHVFIAVAMFGVIGFAATVAFRRMAGKGPSDQRSYALPRGRVRRTTTSDVSGR